MTHNDNNLTKQGQVTDIKQVFAI